MVQTAPSPIWTAEPEPETGWAAPEPLITIAVPAYNRPEMLAETLASIAAQTASVPIEVIVCDDGRMPRTRAVFESFRREGYRFQSNPVTLGAVANWNRCLALARGTFVMVLHEDDILYPWYLETILPRLEDGAAAVCMRTSRGRVPPAVRCPQGGEVATAYPPRYFLKSSMSPFPGVLVRRDVAIRLGGFDERWGPIADYEFWYRLACAGRIEVIGAVGAFYRVAPGQWTERIWGRMLRLTHLLRLRIAREQFPGHPRASRWAARFFTYRNAMCYCKRFGRGSDILQRCLGMGKVPLSGLPAGWVWRALKIASGAGRRHFRFANDAGRTPQIQQGGGRPDRVAA
jgi:glycosyltransferase involved in cell wall biosynthesis